MEQVTNSNIGIQSKGDSINWRYLNEERDTDPIISALVEESKRLFINNEVAKEINYDIKVLNVFIETFNKFLKDNKYKIIFTQSSGTSSVKTSSSKKMSKKDLIIEKNKEDKIKKYMNDFVFSLKITNHHPIVSDDPINAFFNVLFWGIYLLHNKKTEINLSIYLNCSISLYRAINDSLYFLSTELIEESYNILRSLEQFFETKINFSFISRNLRFILDSQWDNSKPKSISLYKEQVDIISLVTSNLNQKKIIFFEMPPANGKTILSAILAKVIAHSNKKNLATIPKYKQKTLLYICYNTIVRNEVAKLCITHNVDCKYWLAVTELDKEEHKMKTFLRPYKNCYPDWNKLGLRSKKEDVKYRETKWMKFSENIHDQWRFFINETMPISEQIKHHEIDFENPDNLPEMIIADLDSAYLLLKEFPDTFVTYFDEAFAASELEITTKIMSVLGLSVLVSATLAKPEEIPTLISDFRVRHGYEESDNSFLHFIKSTKQHISCTFIGPDGCIFAPHNIVDNIELLRLFIDKLEIPIIRRAYSPEVVFNMSACIDAHLPLELKFKNVFRYYGCLTHESLRDYACNILHFIVETNNEELFQILKSSIHKKIDDMDINLMFTKNANFYHGHETLHVATSQNFNNHVERITYNFLRDSPKLSDVFSLYNKENDILKSKLESFKKSKMDKIDKDCEIAKIENDLSNLQLKWPSEFLLNSATHSNKFGNYSSGVVYNTEIRGTIEELNSLDEVRAKLFLSKVGVYQPESFNTSEMNLFLRNKDSFKVILSTPSIVYGTNISLSIIDIDSSFIADSNKNRLYQLIGRAGRKGKSFSASIIFRDIRMLKMILEDEGENVEARQIEQNYQILLTR